MVSNIEKYELLLELLNAERMKIITSISEKEKAISKAETEKLKIEQRINTLNSIREKCSSSLISIAQFIKKPEDTPKIKEDTSNIDKRIVKYDVAWIPQEYIDVVMLNMPDLFRRKDVIEYIRKNLDTGYSKSTIEWKVASMLNELADRGLVMRIHRGLYRKIKKEA
jgi:vacuolar-type H+-ATPase subunit I/STV1